MSTPSESKPHGELYEPTDRPIGQNLALIPLLIQSHPSSTMLSAPYVYIIHLISCSRIGPFIFFLHCTLCKRAIPTQALGPESKEAPMEQVEAPNEARAAQITLQVGSTVLNRASKNTSSHKLQENILQSMEHEE